MGARKPLREDSVSLFGEDVALGPQESAPRDSKNGQRYEDNEKRREYLLYRSWEEEDIFGHTLHSLQFLVLSREEFKGRTCDWRDDQGRKERVVLQPYECQETTRSEPAVT